MSEGHEWPPQALIQALGGVQDFCREQAWEPVSIEIRFSQAGLIEVAEWLPAIMRLAAFDGLPVEMVEAPLGGGDPGDNLQVTCHCDVAEGVTSKVDVYLRVFDWTGSPGLEQRLGAMGTRAVKRLANGEIERVVETDNHVAYGVTERW